MASAQDKTFLPLDTAGLGHWIPFQAWMMRSFISSWGMPAFMPVLMANDATLANA